LSLDVNTLFLITMYVEAILGLLLLLVWVQNIKATAVAWWGFAHLLRSLSIGLFGLYGSVSDLISIDLAGALLFTSFGVTWTGARMFDGRDPRFGSLITGGALWVLACQFSGFNEAPELRMLLSSGIIAAFSWAGAYEFWRGREERLLSRWPAIILLFSHGALFLVRTPLSAALPETAHAGALSSAWMTVLSGEALLFTIAIAFVLLAMAKERAELHQRRAALIDPLTGMANRRAFLQDAEDLIRMQVRRARPVAVFLIDLDHFKSINDRFGHMVGDKVLKLFGDIAKAKLRGTDIIGRLGGEEFAVLLADADRDNAFLVAERLRSAFATSSIVAADVVVSATVSIGIAIIQDPNEDLTHLLASADEALYRAKANGRNQCVLATIDVPNEGLTDTVSPPVAPGMPRSLAPVRAA
jgi:diguanylate cyclase (GGDEF)-like protein